MPWRRRARLLDDLIERMELDRKPLQSIQILAVIELMVERIFAAVRILMVICFFLFVLLIGIAWQVQTRNGIIDGLNKIVNGVIDPKGQAAKDSVKARERLERIEWRLCGGPCPEPPVGGDK